MNEHDFLKLDARRLGRGLLVILALLPGLILAVSLASAGQNGEWSATDLQLHNIAPQSRPVTITWYYASGEPVAAPVKDTLRSRQSKVYLPPIVDPFTGTVHIDTPGQVLGVVTHLDDTPPGAAQWSLIDDRELTTIAHIPYFKWPDESSWRIKIHNLGATIATVSIEFFNLSGAPAHTWGGEVSPRGAQFLDGADLIPPEPDFEGSAVVTADQRIYVDVDRTSPGAFSLAHAPARGGRKLVAPLFQANSSLALQNTSPDVAATGVLSYYGASGILSGTTPFTLLPQAVAIVSGIDLAPLGTPGYVVAAADQPIAGLVLGDTTFPAWDYTAVVVKPDQPDGLSRRTAHGPLVYANHNGWSSEIVIANLSDYPASVTVRYTSASGGNPAARIESLGPHALKVLHTSSWLPDNERGSVSIQSNRLVAATILSVNLSGADPSMAYEAQYAKPVPAPVGGFMLLPTDSEETTATPPYLVFVIAGLAVAAVVAASAWYARRRRLR